MSSTETANTGQNGHPKNKTGNLLRIGSRESQLALKQTHMVKDALQKLHSHMDFDIVTMKTKGDKILDVALSKIGSKSLFTKELEIALESDQVDIVVHSLKDMPTMLPEGMVIGAVTEREDPRDAVILHPKHKGLSLALLPKGSVIGTSSVRRGAQLKRRFPDLVFESIRGNLNTRLKKLDEASDYDAIILAVAGVVRMGWVDRISQYLEEDLCMHAVGQGALAVECREGDSATLELLSNLSHRETLLASAAERALMRTLNGGCSAPVAAHGKVNEDGKITLSGGVWSLDGKEEIVHTLSSCSSDEPHHKRAKTPPDNLCGLVPPEEYKDDVKCAHNLGVSLAEHLIKNGAEKILEEAKESNANTQ